VRAWLLIDMDAIDQATHDRLARQRRDCFAHPPLGVFAVPVDDGLVQHGIELLVREHRIPRTAITIGGR
jgi:hypothetical protein